jgi:hypothetical protein
MAEQQDAALNMLGQSLFSGDAYSQRQQRFNLATQAIQMQSQKVQANNQIQSAVRENYENSMAIAKDASVRPYDRKRLETILGGGYGSVIEEIKNDFNGDFIMYSNNVDASGVSGADKIRNIFFNKDLQDLYEEMNHNKTQFTKIIEVSKENPELVPAAYKQALEEWQQTNPTDPTPKLSRLPIFEPLVDVKADLEDYYKNVGGNYGANHMDIMTLAPHKVLHNMRVEGYSESELEEVIANFNKPGTRGYSLVKDFLENNHSTSGLLNPESPNYVTGKLEYSKGDIMSQIADNLNRESYVIANNDDYKSIVNNLNQITSQYINEVQEISTTKQSFLPYEHLGPLRGKGKRVVTGGVMYDNNTDMQKLLESTLPGYEVKMGNSFGFNNGKLVLKNYNVMKHANVYHAENGTVVGYDELFDLGSGLTYAAGTSMAGAVVGAFTGPGAAVTAAGGFVLGGAGYASTTELDQYKDLTIDKVVLGYKLNLGNGEHELLLDFEDKTNSDWKAYTDKIDFSDSSDPMAGTIEPVHLAYGRDQDLTFSDGYLIELNFNDSSISNLQSKYKDTREDFTRSIAEGKAGAQNYEQSIESAKLSSQRKVAAIEKAQDYITKSFSNNNDPNVYNNIIQTFGTPVESYGKSVGIPESGNQMNQSLLLAEILVSSQYYKDKSTGEYKKLKDSEGTKVATDAFNKVNNLTSVMGLNKSKLAAYKTMTTLDLLEGFRSFYSTDMINDMKRLTLSLRDLKNL